MRTEQEWQERERQLLKRNSELALSKQKAMETLRELSTNQGITTEYYRLVDDAEKYRALKKKAVEVAADMIGYPVDVVDEAAINNATPEQAIESLEKCLRQWKDKYNESRVELEKVRLEVACLREHQYRSLGRKTPQEYDEEIIRLERLLKDSNNRVVDSNAYCASTKETLRKIRTLVEWAL